MADSFPSDEEFSAAVRDILGVLRAVGDAELSAKVECDLGQGDALTALGEQINFLIAQLNEVHRETGRVQSEIESQIATIEQQSSLLSTLAIPVMEAAPGVLCVSIIGAFDERKAQEADELLLDTISNGAIALVIVDLTGAEALSVESVTHLVALIRSASYLGCRAVLSGLRPEVAGALVRTGADLSGIQTFKTIRHALRHFRRGAAAMVSRPARSGGL